MLLDDRFPDYVTYDYMRSVEFEEICEPRLVQRRSAGGSFNLVQPVGLETTAEDPMMEGVCVFRSDEAAEDPVVVRGGVNVGPRTRRIGTAAEGPVRVRGGITFDPGTRRVGTVAEDPVVVRGSVNFVKLVGKLLSRTL